MNIFKCITTWHASPVSQFVYQQAAPQEAGKTAPKESAPVGPKDKSDITSQMGKLVESANNAIGNAGDNLLRKFDSLMPSAKEDKNKPLDPAVSRMQLQGIYKTVQYDLPHSYNPSVENDRRELAKAAANLLNPKNIANVTQAQIDHIQAKVTELAVHTRNVAPEDRYVEEKAEKDAHEYNARMSREAAEKALKEKPDTESAQRSVDFAMNKYGLGQIVLYSLFNQPGSASAGEFVNAVKQFQKEHDLKPDGAIGNKTMAELIKIHPDIKKIN